MNSWLVRLKFINGSLECDFDGIKGNIIKLESWNEFEEVYHIYDSTIPSDLTIEYVLENCKGWVIARTRNSFRVWTDRIGFVPLYYTIEEDGFLLSDIAGALLQQSNVALEPDHIGIWEHMIFDGCLLNRTIYKQMKQLGSGQYITFKERGATEIVRYWCYNFGPKLNLKEDEAVEEVTSLFRASYKKLINNDTDYLLPLSGGHDSRLVAAYSSELINVNRLKTVTYGFSPITKEYKYAKEVTRILKLPSPQFHKLTPNAYNDALNWMNLLSAGTITSCHMHLLDYIRNNIVINSNVTLLTSAYSDAVSGYSAPKNDNINNNWMDNLYIQKLNIFKQWMNINTQVTEGIISDIEHLANEWPNSIFSSFNEFLYVVERNVKFHNPLLRLWNNYTPICSPFIDPKIIEFLYRLPNEFRYNKKITRLSTKKIAPQLSSIKDISSLMTPQLSRIRDLLSVIAGEKERTLVESVTYKSMNFLNFLLREGGLARLELPNPYQTERHANLLQLSLRSPLLESCDVLRDLGIFNDDQLSKIKTRQGREGLKTGFQYRALNQGYVFKELV